MKPARVVWMFWLGNLVLLISVAVVLLSTNGSAEQERDSQMAKLHTNLSTEPRILWEIDAGHAPFSGADVLMSPRERPKPPVPPTPPAPVVEVPPKTDAELQRELEAALNNKFRLQRVMLCSSPDYPDVAMLRAGQVRLQWFEDINLKEEYGNAQAHELRALALDIRVISIDADGVLVNAPSFEVPAKRFDILLQVQTDNVSMNAGRFFPQGDVLKIQGEDAERSDEARESKRATLLHPDAYRYGYPIPKEDFDDKTIDDFARYTKSVDAGLQILPELPKDSPARKYGAQGGEIVKSINGEAVKTMSDVRRVVRTQRDAGVKEFNVEYERDGIPGERLFQIK